MGRRSAHFPRQDSPTHGLQEGAPSNVNTARSALRELSRSRNLATQTHPGASDEAEIANDGVVKWLAGIDMQAASTMAGSDVGYAAIRNAPRPFAIQA